MRWERWRGQARSADSDFAGRLYSLVSRLPSGLAKTQFVKSDRLLAEKAAGKKAAEIERPAREKAEEAKRKAAAMEEAARDRAEGIARGAKQVADLAERLEENIGGILALSFYLIPMICVLTLPVVSPAHGYECGSVGFKWLCAILWPLFGLFSLLGTLVGVEGAAAIVGKIFIGLLIAAGIAVGIKILPWVVSKSTKVLLDARKREKSDRFR